MDISIRRSSPFLPIRYELVLAGETNLTVPLSTYNIKRLLMQMVDVAANFIATDQDSVIDQLQFLRKQGDKIGAIKLIRSISGAGLFEAKHAMDVFWENPSIDPLAKAKEIAADKPLIGYVPWDKIGVYYFGNTSANDGIRGLGPCMNSGDNFKLLLRVDMDRMDNNPNTILNRIKAGLNAGSGKEFKEFRDSDVRSLQNGDVVTLARGTGDQDITSYELSSYGWVKLATSIRKNGPYIP
jgi:hypothetical protein